MPKVGKVLWWDRRDQEGILVDTCNNQFYFNRHSVPDNLLSRIKDELLIEFEPSSSVHHVACATSIKLVSGRSKNKAERTFVEQKQLQLWGP